MGRSLPSVSLSAVLAFVAVAAALSQADQNIAGRNPVGLALPVAARATSSSSATAPPPASSASASSAASSTASDLSASAASRSASERSSITSAASNAIFSASAGAFNLFKIPLQGL
ncbi:hypothetical protein GGX14DRAFT_568649 [Mycena pura]|uniref:Uncharacterized protein n=1 Tax=Mycena pura TaxID=153505 RepID=A0AAD6V8I8_9AGAR|nr:hypothetical protein GGX14DRAFT_568649 [Mycena pura]